MKAVVCRTKHLGPFVHRTVILSVVVIRRFRIGFGVGKQLTRRQQTLFVFSMKSMAVVGTNIGFEQQRSHLRYASLSHEEGLNSESVQLRGDTDFPVSCFNGKSKECALSYSSVLVALNSAAVSSLFLRWMSVAICVLKELLKSSFSQTFCTSLPLQTENFVFK